MEWSGGDASTCRFHAKHTELKWQKSPPPTPKDLPCIIKPFKSHRSNSVLSARNETWTGGNNHRHSGSLCERTMPHFWAPWRLLVHHSCCWWRFYLRVAEVDSTPTGSASSRQYRSRSLSTIAVEGLRILANAWLNQTALLPVKLTLTWLWHSHELEIAVRYGCLGRDARATWWWWRQLNSVLPFVRIGWSGNDQLDRCWSVLQDLRSCAGITTPHQTFASQQSSPRRGTTGVCGNVCASGANIVAGLLSGMCFAV